MMKPNISPMLRGSKLVPSTRPRPAIAMHASGTKVRMIHQCSVRWASTPGACTTDAIGSTMAADSIPWAAPDSTLAIATSQIGQGAWTRSSISRVKPNSCAMFSAIDCTPWNMTEIPTTPGTRMGATARGPRGGRERGWAEGVCAADTLPDLREDVQEDEAEQERLDDRAQHELPQVLAQHHEVPQHQRAQRGPARRGHRAGGAAADRPGRRLGRHRCGHQSLSSFPVRLMKPVSRLGSATDRSARSTPPRSAAITMRGTSR